jgi:hypothetical protein
MNAANVENVIRFSLKGYCNGRLVGGLGESGGKPRFCVRGGITNGVLHEQSYIAILQSNG